MSQRIWSVSVLQSEHDAISFAYIPEDRQNIFHRLQKFILDDKYALPVQSVSVYKFPQDVEEFRVAMSHLNSVETIDFFDEGFDDDRSFSDLFSYCPSVKYLRFHAVKLSDTDIPKFALFPNVAAVSLRVERDAPFTGQGLRSMPVLKSLETLKIIGGTNLHTGISGLKNTPKLRWLEIASDATNSENGEWSALSDLHNLKVLIFYGTVIDNAGIQDITGCKSLDYLMLSSPVDDSCLRHIGKISSLRFLDLSGTQIRGTQLDKLANVENLVELYLDCDLQPNVSTLLPRSNKLEKLVLGGAGLTSNDIAELARFPFLKELELVSTATSSQDILSLQNRKIRRLSLNAEHVSAQDLRELQRRGHSEVLFSFHAYDTFPDALFE